MAKDSQAIDELVTAAAKLPPAQFLRLRKRLDQLEEKHWQEELARSTKELTESGITDARINRMVIERRRENRR